MSAQPNKWTITHSWSQPYTGWPQPPARKKHWVDELTDMELEMIAMDLLEAGVSEDTSQAQQMLANIGIQC
jgi:hypothetical protein